MSHTNAGVSRIRATDSAFGRVAIAEDDPFDDLLNPSLMPDRNLQSVECRGRRAQREGGTRYQQNLNLRTKVRNPLKKESVNLGLWSRVTYTTDWPAGASMSTSISGSGPRWPGSSPRATFNRRAVVVDRPRPVFLVSSGRPDSNRRPSDPQSDALTKLRHGPRASIVSAPGLDPHRPPPRGRLARNRRRIGTPPRPKARRRRPSRNRPWE